MIDRRSIFVLVMHLLFATTAMAADVSLSITDWKGVQRRIAKHHGKIVVVNIWTTTCGKCLEDLPKYGAIAKKHDGIVWMTVACDYDGIPGKPPAYYREGVLKVLRKHGRMTDNVLLSDPFLDFLDQIDLSSTPAVLVYGRDGTLARRFDNDDARTQEAEFTTESVATFVQRLQKEDQTQPSAR
ncbi:TlpA family protein disulfide reductase [Thalassoroseus pseudoceratinae]|uniref:TlpA family protein disulfide reductase n=1 Tax=Thalassoroseus pseudoceratinae TaxID=2713176 RepID=UPI00141FA6F8|nr:TlpA disulfide reductase family protein [Thalassoroseus pseudoceratinae]